MNQEHKEKLAPSLSVKANLVMDKTIGSKPPIESKQSLTTQTLCSKTDDHAFNFTATSQNQLKIEKCTTLQPINQTAGSSMWRIDWYLIVISVIYSQHICLL